MTVIQGWDLFGISMVHEHVRCDSCGATALVHETSHPKNRWLVGSKTVRSVYGHHPVQVMHLCPKCVPPSAAPILGITNWSPVESTQQDWE